MSDYDAIVIGAGHNGLTCAGYLAKAGLRVKVLEKRSVVGGAAVTEEFHPGFRNSVYSYAISLLHPRIISDLRLNEHGLALGTNNIKIRPVRDGVGYLSLLHRTMRCRDRAEAAAVLKAAPRSAAHVYWFADPQGADEHECSADEIVTRYPNFYPNRVALF
jgi:phytoene dehydrogenase-like protein